MMNLLQVAPADSAAVEKVVDTTKDAVSGLAHGDVSYLTQFLQQALTFCVEAGKTILVAVVIYIVGRFVVSLINKLVSNALDRRNLDPSIKTFTKSFVNILLTVLLIIAVVSALGVNTTSFAALLASFGVAIGMALSGNLQNFAGGIIILFLKPYKVGDWVEAQGTAGTVQAIQIFHTILTTTDNKELFVPNGALSSGNIMNYSRNELRRVDFTISVEYGTEIEKVKQVTLGLLENDERILKGPAPFIAVSALADSSVNFALRVWTNASDYWNVFFDTNERIYAEFNKQGIKFPFPQLQIHQV